MSANRSAAELLRMYFGMLHQYLDGTLMGVTNGQYLFDPSPRVAPIAGQYVHIVASEDWLINVKAKGGAPLMATTFAGRTGFAGAPPLVGWADWARETAIDTDAVHKYAQAVYAATDAYLASITDDDLSKIVDMTEAGQGIVPTSAVIGLALVNGALHLGEISTLKGLQDLVGYPTGEVEPETAAA
ncbi:MAG: DinB family protein [Caldilineaceae bacterium]|nr:DinB family protein [Caldilineaceae bacterium]